MAAQPLPRRMAARARVDYLVRALHDRDEIRRILTPHRVYAAYALGQLQPHLFARSEWWLARGGNNQALVLHSRGGLGSALLALGEPCALEAVLCLHPGPVHTFLTCEVQHLDTVLRHFTLPDHESMLRMLVDRETFQPVAGEVRRLIGHDIDEINDLYRSDGTSAFYTAENIDDAVYYGAYDADRLVAVAGTHVISPDDRIAVAGNVFTHPWRRGRGLGSLVTGAVTQHLLEDCREVVLTVAPSNVAAVRAYRRLGYQEVGRLIEGAAVRRDHGLSAFLRRRLAAWRGRRYKAELVEPASVKGKNP